MNIPDEVKIEALRATARDGWMIGTIDPALEVVAEWARQEALDEVLCAAEKNRVILKTVHRGYTVENFSDPLVRIAVIRALAEGEQA